MVCSICYERFTAPVALPCGHIFCRECIRRVVEASQLSTLQHLCPTCRAGYSVVSVDPAILPAYIRPHILPTLRPVFFDDPSLELAPAAAASCVSTSATPIPPPVKAEGHQVEALRLSCETWRRRAEVHAAANAGLLGFARAAKDYTQCMRAERDQALNRCAVLERKLAELRPAPEADAVAPDQELVQGGANSELPQARIQPIPPSQSDGQPDGMLTWTGW
ncbi:hypothetical protein DFH08DRAFT_880772 [Mycena albidolilacea]|uniref:RING-type domain-containing protein n=1 Tax=Mycena albidolilacea TaxID=1033008 RepID=A0AAD7EM05_9AGAR|nr:hypothetical protein DFH08DRAFT_880772 [Mycena albidolilacea]